ncbi:aminotransferase class IV [Streptomyces sp. NBC_00091]|uniref:aminotransferase class IV n=1 Tax=Streptomyces sp. NBC_00091 TaxID=2975648 RepID=UPI002255768D|nr:aminotransferase class IV [Streptomyces sp. NBC_00091]MCX5380976.1 aminotransferase class IV [Streptomyces sp. NBC_00091]
MTTGLAGAGEGGERVLLYGPGGLVEGEAAGELAVADSWLVEEGRVRELPAHWRRFGAGVAEAGGPDLEGFPEAVARALPRRGCWFPRVELVGGRLQLRVRVAPARTDAVRLWAGGDDPRRTPRRKGPDLGALGKLRARAVAAGADDALLVSDDGVVLETATASLVWWEGDVLCVVDPGLPVLAGVTVAWVVRRAGGLGIAVRRSRVRAAELSGREVWVTNALHGLRPVTGWVGADVAVGPAPRVQEWRAAWAAAAEPLPR